MYYDFYIRAKCNGTFGDWTTKNSFTFSQLYFAVKNIQTSNFEIYPNPVEEILHMKLKPVFDSNTFTVLIYDLIGTIRFKSQYNDNYNISSLPTCIYIVEVKDEQLSETMIMQKK